MSAKVFYAEDAERTVIYTTLGDDTGDIRLVDERVDEQYMTSPLNRLNVGDRIKVVGVETGYRYYGDHYYKVEGIRDITLTQYGSILKV